jgi:uroporphyrinogen-III synthase
MAPQPPRALLLTRPQPAARRFLEQVRAASGQPVACVISPLIEVVAVPWDGDLSHVAALILTSQNALSALAGRIPPGLRAWCVGDATARAAQAMGLDARSAGGDAEGLVAAIRASGEPGPCLHLRGDPSRGDIAARLTAAGIPTQYCVVYRQAALPLSADARRLLQGTAPVVVPVFSPETAAHLTGQGPFAAPLHLVAISAATAAVLALLGGVRMLVADRPDGPAMVRATLDQLRDPSPKG